MPGGFLRCLFDSLHVFVATEIIDLRAELSEALRGSYRTMYHLKLETPDVRRRNKPRVAHISNVGMGLMADRCMPQES
jgi:hypothetical protein